MKRAASGCAYSSTIVYVATIKCSKCILYVKLEHNSLQVLELWCAFAFKAAAAAASSSNHHMTANATQRDYSH